MGQIEPEKFDSIKQQITARILELVKSEELTNSVSTYLRDAMERFRPQTLGEALQHVDPDSIRRAKDFLSEGSAGTFVARRYGANDQPDSEFANRAAADCADWPSGRSRFRTFDGARQPALVERITTAARERLPTAIAEFDVGGLVRKKVSDYPVEKLEALVLSVAQHHLKTIELFGAVIGFFIGVGQAIYFWLTYTPSTRGTDEPKTLNLQHRSLRLNRCQCP